MYQETVRRAVETLRTGAPMTEGALCIVPLTSTSEVKARYVVLEQAIKQGTIIVTEVSEGGAVPYLRAVNKGPWPVLIFDGEELMGAKQNRIANTTILVGVGEKIIPVSCVEQGRWSHRTRTFSTGAYASHPKLRADKERHVRERLAAQPPRGSVGDRVPGSFGDRVPADDTEPQLARAMRFLSDQRAVWDEVSEVSSRLRAHSPTAALADVYEAGKHDLDKLVHSLALDSQTGSDSVVGAVVFVGGTFACLDLLQPAKRFARLYHKLVRGYALEALLNPNPVSKDFDPEAATSRLLSELLEASVQVHPGVDLGFDLRLDTELYSGSGLLWEDELVQLSVFPKATSWMRAQAY